MASNATLVNRGYGQVEPNHLSAQRTAQIYAQLPAAASYDFLENGQFVKYDYAKGEVNTSGAGEWMLVYNEVKVYKALETDADFALKKNPAIKEGKDLDFVPRVFKTNIGDIFTTNCVKATKEAIEGASTKVLYVGEDGYLTLTETGDMKWEIVKVYTLPDGQDAVKIMRIA